MSTNSCGTFPPAFLFVRDKYTRRWNDLSLKWFNEIARILSSPCAQLPQQFTGKSVALQVSTWRLDVMIHLIPEGSRAGISDEQTAPPAERRDGTGATPEICQRSHDSEDQKRWSPNETPPVTDSTNLYGESFLRGDPWPESGGPGISCGNPQFPHTEDRTDAGPTL